MQDHHIDAILEALFLAADTPLTIGALSEIVPELDRDDLIASIERLMSQYCAGQRGMELVKVAGGYQLRTSPECADYVRRLYEAKPVRLSRAAMETLAIVAYRQPITRAELEEIRGVDCSAILRKLADHDLLQVVGRLDDIGKPNIYGTTPYFLEFFALESLSELPVLDAQEQQVLVEMKDALEKG